MRFKLIGDQYLNGLTNNLAVAVAKYSFGCRVYQYNFTMTASKYNTFGCVFKKRNHVFPSEHQYIVSVSNDVNIIKYRLGNGRSFFGAVGLSCWLIDFIW